LNSRLRKRYLDSSIKVFYIGETQNNTFKTEHLGSSYKSLIDLVEGRSMFLRELFKAKNPIIVVGSHTFSQKNGYLLFKLIKNLLKKSGLSLRILNVLHDTANITGLLNLGFKSISKKDLNKLDLIIGLNSDSTEFFNLEKNDRFYINLNYQGNSVLSDSDVILAGSSFTEQNAMFSNTENRVQKTEKAVSLVGNARKNSQIFESLSLFLNKSLKTNLNSYVP
jgi:NADH-quinone oxidoreductase subunit G